MRDPKDLTDDERKKMWKEAQDLRKTEGKKSKEAYDRMSSSDKEEFDRIMKKLRDKNLSDEERGSYLDKLEELAKKYQD